MASVSVLLRQSASGIYLGFWQYPGRGDAPGRPETAQRAHPSLIQRKPLLRDGDRTRSHECQEARILAQSGEVLVLVYSVDFVALLDRATQVFEGALGQAILRIQLGQH